MKFNKGLPVLLLAVETSCDETAVAIYDTTLPIGQRIVGHALFSQIERHQLYGGVVPELASRDHIEKILPLTQEALRQAQLNLDAIDVFACTTGPGLSGALLVGTAFTHALAFAQNKPLIPIHHLEGHLASVFLNENTSEHPDFPFIALLVSGGHSQLYRVNAPCDYELLGDTLDDAAGEAFDKSAKLLGLPYPGGAMLSALAQQGEASFNLPRPMLHSGDLNFSFSGLKTAVLNCVQKEQLITPVLSAQTKANVARSFVEAVVEVLVSKSKQALKTHQLKQLVVVGGVSANIQLREGLQHMLAKQKGQVFFPALKWCTDNAAMIAQAAAWRYQHLLDQQQDLPTAGNFSVRPRWNLNDQ